MSFSIQQQMIISGVGGQGILFVTRLLADAAIATGLPVFTSETHGMAQRGGTVLSHIKIGNYSSPLIRPFKADGLLVLKAENMAQHRSYLKPGGWAVVNTPERMEGDEDIGLFCVNADDTARKIKNPRAVNLITLGYALSVATSDNIDNPLFCSLEDIINVLEKRQNIRKTMAALSIEAIKAGFEYHE